MADRPNQVLIVDDDPVLRGRVGDWLAEVGFAVHAALSGEEALAALEVMIPDAVLIDLELPGMAGLELLRRLSARLPRVPAIVLTAHSGAEVAVECMKAGAYDYLLKPAEQARLVTTVANAVRQRRLALAVGSLEREVRRRAERGGGAGAERELQLQLMVERAAESDSPVLVRGSDPARRRTLARAVLDASRRAGGPLVQVACGELSPERQEEALRDAAATLSSGRGGSLILEDVERLGPGAQQLLCAALLEAGRVRSGAGHGLEFRLVATDGTDLAALVRQGRYRGDLYMRLAVTELNLAEGAAGGPAEDSLRLFDQERRAILDALERTKGNRAAASRALGISRATLYRKLHEHGFE